MRIQGWQRLTIGILFLLAGLILPVAGHAGALEDALDNPVGADGVTPLAFSTDGAASWSPDAATSYAGSAAARSGAIGATAFSALTTTVSGPASLSFYQKVSSEPAYDALTFYIDNLTMPKYKASGEVNWQQKKFTLPAGSHTLRWKYAKNATINKGSDAAWLDKVVVSPYTALAVTSPNGGESLAAGGTATITWHAPAGAEKYDLYYTTNNGTSWKLITSGYTSPDFPNVAYSSWALPVPNGNVSACKVKVVARNAAGSVVATDVSDKPFTVQVLKVTSPNGGETLSAKASPTIAFTISGQQSVASAAISYTLNNGTSWSAITTLKGAFPPGSYSYSSWNVPAVTTLKSACKVKVVLKSATGAILGTDLSDLTFVIAPVFTLSGVVTLNGHALAGVTMNLSGAGSGSTTTDVYGKYSFTKLSSGNYTITPALSGYLFTPASVNRTISGANVTGVNYSAQILPTGWSSQVRIGDLKSATHGYDLYSLKVKLNDSDVGVAVWEENNGTHSEVWANRFSGGGWGSPVRVSVGLSGSSEPEVALAANGNATALWTEKVYDQYGILIVSKTVWASRYTAASGTWSAPVRISNAPTADSEFYAFSPAVAHDSLGHAIVVWVQDDPVTPTRSIWTSRDDGSGWSAPELLSSGTRHCEEDFLAVDDQDNVFVVWRQDTNAYDSGAPGCYNAMTNIWAVIYSSASHSWGAPGLIGDPTLGLCDGTERPRIAVNSGGTAVVLWEQSKGSVSSIGSSRFDPETLSWQAPVTVGVGNPWVSWPAVALDGDGNAFAAWIGYGGDGPEDGWVSQYDASGGGWSAPTLFETDTTDVDEVAIDVDGSGNAHLVWVAAGIKARRYTLSGGGAATAIGGENHLTLDVNSNGSALVGSNKTTFDPWTGFYCAPYAARYYP